LEFLGFHEIQELLEIVFRTRTCPIYVANHLDRAARAMSLGLNESN
jgi:hypothetical protein